MNRLKTTIKSTYIFGLFLIVLVISNSCQLRSKKALVTSKIQKTAKIATQEVVLSKYVMFDDKKRIIPFTERPTKLIYVEAYVKFGVDLKKISSDDVQIQGDILKIKLPAVEELNFSIPLERIEQQTLDLKKIPRRRNKDPELWDDLLQSAQKDIRETIKYMNLKQSAEDRTRFFMTTFLEQLGFGAVIIEFKESNS